MVASVRRPSGALRNLSVKALSQALDRASRLFVIVASGPVLGERAFGRFVFASTVTSLLALGTDLGTGVWTTRELARRPVDGERIVSVGLALRAAAALPYGLAVAAVSIFVVRGEERAAMILLGIAALANAFVDHFGAILRGHERFPAEARLNGSRAILTGVTGLTALAVGRSLTWLCIALVVSSLASCLYGLTLLLLLHPRLKVPGSLRALPFDRDLAISALKESLPIWFAGLVSLLYFKIDTVFLRFLAGDAELGAYGAAYKFFEGSMILPSVLLSVAFPQLARAQGDPKARQTLERRLVMVLVALGLLVGTACLVGGSTLVRVVFGASFGRAVAPLRLLALGLPFLYLNFGLTHFLLARDRGQATLWLSVMTLALNLCLDFALIPRGLGPGAALATVLSELALSLGCLVALRRVTLAAPLPSAQAGPRTGQRAA